MMPTRIFDLLDRMSVMFPKDDAFAVKRNGQWEKFSTDTLVLQSDWFSMGLMQLGLAKGDKIATVSNNRPEWNIADMGMAQVGVVHVPVYATISRDEYIYILTHCDAKILIVSDNDLYQQLKPVVAKISSILAIYTFDKVEGANHWTEITELGKENARLLRNRLADIKITIRPDDLMTIIYTSGTTGLPKGVMLSHTNFIFVLVNIKELHPLNFRHRVLSFLPLCHVFERCVVYAYMYFGISVYYAENMTTIADDMKDIRPHGFTTVPRLLEKLYDRIITTGKGLPLWMKMVFFWAIRLGLRYELDGRNGKFYQAELLLANRLVFNKWREAMGGNIKMIICGGAALQSRLERIFWAAGIPVQNCYGLTETAPLIAGNRYKSPNIRFGTVGQSMTGAEIRIGDDGEILARGKNVMLGYYKHPEMTVEVIDAEGWFHTGDIGRIDEDGFLMVTDRKKEIFKLSTGKYVAPQVVENKLKESLFVEHAIVLGEGQKFVSALIIPNFAYIAKWSKVKNLNFKDRKQIVKSDLVIQRLQREVDAINEGLGHWEAIRKFKLLPDEWSPKSGELSPTLKLRRKVVLKKYIKYINRFYTERPT
jgi:long-chain acyl-CoA synthetase